MLNSIRITMFTMALLFACISCQSYDADHQLVSFNGSLCKKEASAALTMNALYTLDDSADLSGLQCISWRSGDATAKIDLTNFKGACGADWHGDAAVSDDGVDLSVTNPECLIASCGWCIYDWSFEVDEVEVSSLSHISIDVNTCPQEQDIDTYEASLPAGAPEGLMCRYADYWAIQWQAMATGEEGTAHMPCRTEENTGDTAAVPCNGDLVCAENGDGDETHRICLIPCETDGDCPTPEILNCQGGLCKISDPWE